MSRNNSPQPCTKRLRFITAVVVFTFVSLVTIGVFAKNEWFPSTDALSGKKTGWFGKPLPNNASSSWNPFAQPLPPPALQRSKEYIYAGSQLLAVEDANANAVVPADLAIWRPSTGTWWVMGGAAGSQQVTQGWGLSTDQPVEGDYDGDGKTDFSVFRPSTGEWYVLRSSDNAWSVLAWGTQTDVRVPADYDGDGKTDRAVWRSNGVWYIVRSSDQVSVYQTYGLGSDLPAPADYDGDGRADLTVWRNSNRTFYSISSSNNSTSSIVSIDQPSTEPVSADYDGDGKADHAIRSGSNWIIRQSGNGQTIVVAWQQATDLAVHNDYDGDGKVDIATWRPNNSPAGTVGNWFIRQSAYGYSLRQVQWGIAGDVPVPAFYRR